MRTEEVDLPSSHSWDMEEGCTGEEERCPFDRYPVPEGLGF